MQAPKSNKKYSKEGLVGLEFENQLIYSKTGFVIQKKDILKLWRELLKCKKFKPIYDQYTKVLIGVTKKIKGGDIVINTDTGVCLLELAMLPRKNLIDAGKEWKKEFNSIIKIAKKFGFTAIDLAVTPRSIKQNTYSLKTDKGLYKLINDRMSRHNVMIPIASHQVCVDVDLKNIIKTVNALTKLGGLLISLTANSVIENDKIQSWKEIRTLHWDVPMCNAIKNGKKIFGEYPSNPYDGLSGYLKNIWRATPLVIIKNGKWSKINDKNITVWKYLNNKNGFYGRTTNNKKIKLKATKDDLNLMMMLAWNDVKPHVIVDTSKVNLYDFIESIKNKKINIYLKNKVLNSYIEVRMCPTSPQGEELAFPALILGLVNNLSETIKFSNKFTWREGKELKQILSVRGMDYSFKKKPITDYLKELVRIAERGLKMRKVGEEKYLQVLYDRIKNKQTPADRTIEVFQKKGIQGVIKEFSY